MDIFKAIEKNDIEGVKRTLKSGVNIDVKNFYKLSPLIVAAGGGCKKIVSFLIENGANIDEKNNYYGTTALIAAAENGRRETVRLLIDKGANVNVKNNSGNTPLLSAVYYEYVKTVRLLIDKGANISVKDNNGMSVLMFAVNFQNTEIVQLLLDNGAKNIPNNKGETPFKIAIEKNDKEILKLLLTTPIEELFI